MASPPKHSAAEPAGVPTEDLSTFLTGWKRDLEKKKEVEAGGRAPPAKRLAIERNTVAAPSSHMMAGDIGACSVVLSADKASTTGPSCRDPPPPPPDVKPLFVIRTKKFEEEQHKAAPTTSPPRAEARTETSSSPQIDFVQELIDDLDDINDVPMLDFVLPRDVAHRILASLDIVTLCRVAQISKTWKILADDNVLWHAICRRMRYRGKLEPFSHVADWKGRVAAITLRRQEIDRRWRRMEAAFTTLDVHEHHERDEIREGASVPITASLFLPGNSSGGADDGGCVAGRGDGSVARYDAHGEPCGFFGARSGNPVVAVAAGATVFAALTATRGVPSHAHAHVIQRSPLNPVLVSRQVELEVWSAGVGGDPVFLHVLPGDVTHDTDNGHMTGQPGGRAALEVHSRDPTVFVGTTSSLRCYSAVRTGEWGCFWDVPAPSGLHEMRLVLDRTLAVLARGGVTLRDCTTGEVSAMLLDATELGVRCSALSVGNGNVMFGALDSTLRESVLHVCDAATGLHRASLEVSLPFFRIKMSTLFLANLCGPSHFVFACKRSSDRSMTLCGHVCTLFVP